MNAERSEPLPGVPMVTFDAAPEQVDITLDAAKTVLDLSALHGEESRK